MISFAKWFMQISNTKNHVLFLKKIANKIPEKYEYVAFQSGINPNRVLLSKYIDEVATVGAFDYYVLLPDMEYSEQDIRNILRHEVEHIQHKDILVKMILHMARCIMWWNPIFALFECDYSLLSEYRCDDNAVRGYSDLEKISYVETLKMMAVVKSNSLHRCNVAGFAITSKKSTLISRANRVLDKNKYHKRSAAMVMLGIALFLLSYTVQIQPSYDAKLTNNVLEVSPNNAYIKSINGEYVLYIDDEVIEYLEEKDLIYSPYNRLEIRK